MIGSLRYIPTKPRRFISAAVPIGQSWGSPIRNFCLSVFLSGPTRSSARAERLPMYVAGVQRTSRLFVAISDYGLIFLQGEVTSGWPIYNQGRTNPRVVFRLKNIRFFVNNLLITLPFRQHRGAPSAHTGQSADKMGHILFMPLIFPILLKQIHRGRVIIIVPEQ